MLECIGYAPPYTNVQCCRNNGTMTTLPHEDFCNQYTEWGNSPVGDAHDCQPRLYVDCYPANVLDPAFQGVYVLNYWWFAPVYAGSTSPPRNYVPCFEGAPAPSGTLTSTTVDVVCDPFQVTWTNFVQTPSPLLSGTCQNPCGTPPTSVIMIPTLP